MELNEYNTLFFCRNSNPTGTTQMKGESQMLQHCAALPQHLENYELLLFAPMYKGDVYISNLCFDEVK